MVIAIAYNMIAVVLTAWKLPFNELKSVWLIGIDTAEINANKIRIFEGQVN